MQADRRRNVRPETSKEALEILDEYLRRSPAERPGFLSMACANNKELRKEVNSLLAAEDESGDFMDEPLLRLPPKGES